MIFRDKIRVFFVFLKDFIDMIQNFITFVVYDSGLAHNGWGFAIIFCRKWALGGVFAAEYRYFLRFER